MNEENFHCNPDSASPQPQGSETTCIHHTDAERVMAGCPCCALARIAEVERDNLALLMQKRELERALAMSEDAAQKGDEGRKLGTAYEGAMARVKELEGELDIARGCKPDEFTHVLASERIATQRVAELEESSRRGAIEMSKLTTNLDTALAESARLREEMDWLEKIAIRSLSWANGDTKGITTARFERGIHLGTVTINTKTREYDRSKKELPTLRAAIRSAMKGDEK